MKALVPFACALLGAVAQAQISSNPVWRTNLNWYWFRGTDPATGYNQMPAELVPPAYTATPAMGVTAGSHTWRWIPEHTNLRREPRRVTGFDVGVVPSAATPSTSFPLTGYLPETTIHVAKPRSGGGMDPDFSVPPLVTLVKGSYTFTTFGAFSVTRTLSAPVPITTSDVILATRWEGGEHQGLPGGQAVWGSSRESQYLPITWGYADAANVIGYPPPSAGLTQQMLPRINYFEQQPSIAAQSDWGQQNLITRSPALFGYGLGTAQAPLASTAGMIGWDVHAGVSRSGSTAVPLFNVGSVFPIGLPLLGVTLEVNPGDPAVGLLAAAGYVLTIDATGVGDGPLVPVPALGPQAIGTYIGVEFVLVDPQLNVVDSTQAHYMTITR